MSSLPLLRDVPFGPPNGSDVQRRGRFRVPKQMLMLAPLNEARKRRAEAGPRPLLCRVGRRRAFLLRCSAMKPRFDILDGNDVWNKASEGTENYDELWEAMRKT